MQRRTMLQLTGTALATVVGAGNSVGQDGFGSVRQSTEPITFENSEDLLIEAALLPGDGWERNEVGEDEILDASVVFDREFEGEDSFWVVRSAAAGRDTEAEAVNLYEELYADYSARVGEARITDLGLASEAAIAGYDGRTKAIVRDVNCVGSIGFADCTSSLGCLSHVDRTERLAEAKRRSWRGTGDNSTGNGADQRNEADEPSDDGPDGVFVDEVDGQVSLSYGETARVSNGAETTVSEGTLYEQMGDEVPEERERFLVVPVEAENTADEPRSIPDQTDSWDVIFGDQQLGNVFRSGALDAEGHDAFEGGDVQGGIRRTGVLLFEVDAGFETDEFDVLWQDNWLVAGDLDGAIDVRWSTGE